jgi:hypothetical protein
MIDFALHAATMHQHERATIDTRVLRSHEPFEPDLEGSDGHVADTLARPRRL